MKRSFGNMRLGGRYRLSDRIAFGGMGEVWRALDEVLGRKVAVKILRPELAYDDSFRRRFRAEARTAGALSHPGIAAVYDYGEGPVVPADASDELGTTTPGNGLSGDEVAYLVMELVPGEPLSTMLGRGALGVDQTLDIVAQTARALHAAHERQVVHRDVKPANLLVTPEGVVKVTDFGIARPKDHEPLTMTGQVMGTAHYLAPELARGREASALSDVYALGVVMYECLAGRRPFEGDNQVAVATAHLAEPPPPLPDVLPADVRELVDMAMEKDPAHRISSAAAFAHELEVTLRRRKRPNRHGGAAGSAGGAGGAGGPGAPREIDLRDRDGAPSGTGAALGAGVAGFAGGAVAGAAAAGGAPASWTTSTTPPDGTGYGDHGGGPTFAQPDQGWNQGYQNGYAGQNGYEQNGYGTGYGQDSYGQGWAQQNGYGQDGYGQDSYGYGQDDATNAYGQGGYPNGPQTPQEDLGLAGSGSHRSSGRKVVPFEMTPRNIGVIAAVVVVVIGVIAMITILTQGGGPSTPAPQTTPSASADVTPSDAATSLPGTPSLSPASTPTRTKVRTTSKNGSKSPSATATTTPTPTTTTTPTPTTTGTPTGTPTGTSTGTPTGSGTATGSPTTTATAPGSGAGAGSGANAGGSTTGAGVVVP